MSIIVYQFRPMVEIRLCYLHSNADRNHPYKCFEVTTDASATPSPLLSLHMNLTLIYDTRPKSGPNKHPTNVP